MKTEITNRDKAQRSYEQMLHAVQLKWHNATPRVIGWADTLVDAFEAHFAGDLDRNVSLPAGATTGDGDTIDTAGRVLEAFDAWLGRDLVAHVLKEVK